MTDQSQLERRYRRLLAWYPRQFRREHEEEMLVVLLACARAGRRRPGIADTVDLLRHAVWMRLRPSAPRSQPTVFWGVRLMVLAAALELAAMGAVIASQAAVRTAVARSFPQLGAAHVAAMLHGQVAAVEIGAPIAAGAWLALAWANDRGYRPARLGLLAVFGLTCVSLLSAVGRQAATYASADLVAALALWLVALAATLLIFATDSDRHYHRPGAGGGDLRSHRSRSGDSWRGGPDIAIWN